MISQYLDATLLNPDARLDEYDACVTAAVNEYCRGLVVPTSIIADKEVNIQDIRSRYPDLKISTVIGYPLGNESVDDKCRIMHAYQHLVDEFDVVLNLAYIKSNYQEKTWAELQALCEWNKYRYKLKVIIETPLLTHEEIIETTNLLIKAHVELGRIIYIKTATGRHGVTKESDAANIRFVLGDRFPNLGIKVSGGIRTIADVKKFDVHGVQVYGVSYPHFVNLIKEARES